MKKHLFGTALLVCLIAIGSMASAQTIDDIQQYDPGTGAPASPFVGQSVTVTGTIYVVSGTYNSGTWYIQGATGGINFFDGAAGPFVLGDVIELSGTVGDFSGEINISSPSAVWLSAGPEAVPATKTVTELIGNYEEVGNLVEVIGNIAATSFDGGSETFWINTGTDTLEVFVDSDTDIDLTAVEVGDLYKISGPYIVYNGTLEMKPRFQGDLVENPLGDTVPVISNVTSPGWVLEAADPLIVTATITDNSAIAAASVFYTDSDGTTQGAWSSVAMSNTGGNSWAGTVPGGHTGSQVDFYVSATDDGAQTVTNPGTAPATFLTAAVGFTSLYAINTVHPDSSYQGSPLRDSFVNITGVVTAGVGAPTNAQSRFVVQEVNPNPATDSYAYGGILVYEGTGANEILRGDEVAIGGQIDEFFGLTEMLPFHGDAVEIVSFSGQLPPPVVRSTRELADNSLLDGNGILGEQWESVWVKTFPSAVIDTAGYNYLISSFSSRNDSLTVDPSVSMAYLETMGDVITIESYMTYAGGEYRIVPWDDNFIHVTALSGVDNTPMITSAGGFRSVAPNPFNPMTEIKFVVNRDNLVQLNVYNIRGQKVRTLVNDHMSANEYKFVFDGKNDAGQTLASGAYFARLRIGTEVLQVRQLMLVK